MTDETVYSAQEVADILKIKKNTVYNLIKRGELVAYKVGNKMRVSDAEIENYKKRAVTGHIHEQESPAHTGGNQRYIRAVEPLVLDEPVQRPNGFIICGQDSALDTLANQLQTFSEGKASALRSYVGSYNGLYMLYQGQASVASTHLWHAKTDTYNIPYVESMLPGVPAVIVHLFRRMQGFYVQSGNPKKIISWEDFARQDITMVNREKGSGTRALLDEKLRLCGINHQNIAGYRRECFSHLAVAGVVARGGADVGLGSLSSVKQIPGLEFIPMQQESYDLVIKREDISKPMFRLMLDIIRSPEYRMSLEGMGVYDLTSLGQVIAET